MPHSDVLIIETTTEDTFVFRYAAGREFGGDARHESVDPATAQAQAGYEGAVGEWIAVPDDVSDAASYAIRALRPHICAYRRHLRIT